MWQVGRRRSSPNGTAFLGWSLTGGKASPKCPFGRVGVATRSLRSRECEALSRSAKPVLLAPIPSTLLDRGRTRPLRSRKNVGRLPGFPRHVPATGGIGGRSRKCSDPWPCRYTGQGPPPAGMPLRLPPRSPRTGPRCCRASRGTCRSVEPEPPWTTRTRRNSRRGRRCASAHRATGCRPRAGCPRRCPEVRQPARPVPVTREQDVGAPGRRWA